MTQTSSNMSKSLADENRSRDVRRRIEVIQRKLSDLQELGIPCAFCYSSARNTGSIFTLGDTRITDVFERHKNEILVNLSGSAADTSETSHSKEIHLILPPLPSPLEEIPRSALQSIIVGILKDLGIKWTDPTPSWWPMDIPFIHPRSMPQIYYGNLVQGLRKILESVYSYFSYNVKEYIADKLEQENTDTTTELSRTQPQATMDGHDDTSTTENEQPPPEKRPSKTISNFTVENILSSPQHNSTSNSSISPSSTSTGSNRSPTDYSSSLPANWVSHPPVKYTKYTMLSPRSMNDDKLKRKPTSTESRPRHHSSSTESPQDFHKLSIRRVPSNPIARVSSGDHVPYGFPTTSNGHASLLSSDKQKSQSSNNLNTKGVSTLPVIQAIPYTTAVSGKALMQQNFPPSQQFVLLVPSTSASVNEQMQTLVYSTQAQTKPTPIRASSTELTSKEHSVSESDKRMMEVSYRPIAPKNKTIFREMQPTSIVEKKGLRRTPSGTKPQKLRFHMTTVVKRPKHNSMMTSSMTVESPSVASERTKTTSFVLEPQSAEKSITRAKNNYSSQTEDEIRDQSPQSNLSTDEVASNTSYELEETNRFSPRGDLKITDGKKELTFIHCHEDKLETPVVENGRTTRSYTRRKRDLTFHLYEDPATAFKPKRNCKE